MPNVESTAVNELVDLAQQNPLDGIDDDLFGAPKARRGLFEAPPAPPAPLAPAPAPLALAPAPLAQPRIAAPIAQPPAVRAAAPLFLDAPASDSRPHSPTWRRFALPAAAVVALAIGGGIAVAHVVHGSAAPAVAQAKPIVVEPATPAPVLVPPPAPKLVDVRLESTPPGATATLLSDGTATPLGATPVVASVDPSKRYDVVFATDGQPSQVVHLDPSTTHDLQVAFAPPAPTVVPAPVAPAAPVASAKHVASAKQASSTAKARHHHHASRAASKRANAPKLADPVF